MQVGDQELVVVGDRVLVRPEDGESTTNAGLILPASVADRESVHAGRVVSVGPGLAAAPAGTDLGEDWSTGRIEPRYVAMQARVGDVAIYHRKAAVDITVAHEKYVVIPHGAILVLLRSSLDATESSDTIN